MRPAAHHRVARFLTEEVGLGYDNIARYLRDLPDTDRMTSAAQAGLGIIVSVLERTSQRALSLAPMLIGDDRQLTVVLNAIEVEAVSEISDTTMVGGDTLDLERVGRLSLRARAG